MEDRQYETQKPGNMTSVSGYEAAPDPVREKRKEQSRKLCILSLVIGFGVTAALAGIDLLLMKVFMIKNLHFWINECMMLFPQAGLVLMIIARVRDPESRFGKILMWLYIAAAAVAALITVIGLLFGLVLFAACLGGTAGCR